MSALATTLLCAIALSVTVVALSGWFLVRSARRVRVRLAAHLPGAFVHRQQVGAQTWLPGPARQIAIVRRDLRREVHGAVCAVKVGLTSGRPVQALSAISARLERSATHLDTDLAVIAAEPHRARRDQLLRERDAEIQALRHSCEQVRRGVLLAGSAITGPLLPALVNDLNDELIRLGLWAQAHHELQTD